MIAVRPAKSILTGAGAGIPASLVMAMYAMIAALFKDAGFFTPLYHIASLVAPGDAMMASMKAAMAGDPVTFVFGIAMLGAIIHMMTGAMYGAIFGAFASRMSFGLGGFTGIGVVFGFAVFLASAFAGLPTAAGLFGAGDPIRNMAAMAGWGTFLVEHLMFGAALGAIVATSRKRTAPVPSRAH
jgi:hypothetical protein